MGACARHRQFNGSSFVHPYLTTDTRWNRPELWTCTSKTFWNNRVCLLPEEGTTTLLVVLACLSRPAVFRWVQISRSSSNCRLLESLGGVQVNTDGSQRRSSFHVLIRGSWTWNTWFRMYHAQRFTFPTSTEWAITAMRKPGGAPKGNVGAESPSQAATKGSVGAESLRCWGGPPAKGARRCRVPPKGHVGA